MGVGDTYDYKATKEAIKEIIENKEFKVILIDKDGNVLSDVKLSGILNYLIYILTNCISIGSTTGAIHSDTEMLIGALKSKNLDSILTTIKGSEIQVPADLQSILNYVEEKYGLDETVAQSITLDKGGFKTVDVYAKATAPTTFTVEYSYNGTDWDVYYESKVPEKKYKDTIRTAARYIRLSSAAAGAAGDTVDLVIAAVP